MWNAQQPRSHDVHLKLDAVQFKTQQLLPEKKDPTPAETVAAVEAASRERLDAVAKQLITATTIVIAVIGAVGLTGDRIAVLLNSTLSGALIAIAVIAAGLAVALGTAAIGDCKHKAQRRLVIAGIVAFCASLIFTGWAASTAFDDDGRPNIAELSVSDAANGASVVVSFTVTSDGSTKNSMMRVVAIWVRNGPNDQLQPPFYAAAIRPDAQGLINQKVSLILPRPDSDHFIRVQVIRASDQNQASALKAPPPGTLCSDQADQRTAPACAEVLVPAAIKEK